MLKGGLYRVTTNRGKPDASDLGAAGFRRDRLRPDLVAKFVPTRLRLMEQPKSSGNAMASPNRIASCWSPHWRSDRL
jgi:hypothetical protein